MAHRLYWQQKAIPSTAIPHILNYYSLVDAMIEFILLAAVIAGAFFFFRKKSPRQGSLQTPEWMRGFIIFYATQKVSMSFATGSAYHEVLKLIQRELNFSDQQSILVWMRGYMAEIGVGKSDITAEVNGFLTEAPNVLQFEMAGYNTPAAIMHLLITENPEMSGKPKDELNDIAQQIHRGIKIKEPEAMQFEDMLIRFRLNRVFEKMHSMPLQDFSEKIMNKIDQNSQ